MTVFVFFFFKQKTAYEMRMSDWSSDVCSSDLVTTAYDAVTGREIWRYDPQVPRRFGGFACCDINSRGVAAWKGKIFIATLDGRLIALDARTGKPMWSQQTLDPGWAYTITGAPRVDRKSTRLNSSH